MQSWCIVCFVTLFGIPDGWSHGEVKEGGLGERGSLLRGDCGMSLISLMRRCAVSTNYGRGLVSQPGTGSNVTQQELPAQLLEEASAAAQPKKAAEAEPTAQQTSEFDQLEPGRRLSSPLPYSPGRAAWEPGTARFSATILDVAGMVAEAALQSCCVFLVPQVSTFRISFWETDGRATLLQLQLPYTSLAKPMSFHDP